MKTNWIFLKLIIFLLLLATGVQAQDMPDFVLRAAQDLNARFGAVIDLNNVVWDYTQYSTINYDPADECPHIMETLPRVSAVSPIFYVVELKPVLHGSWGHEIWKYLVYGDLSFMTPCMLPPTPVPTLTPFAPRTPIPPTATVYLSPVPTATPANCPGLLPSRLQIGQQARVSPVGGFPNNVRDVPGTSGNWLGEIPSEGVFTVLDGPRCFSDFAWWQVNYNGLVGWTPEGDRETYWLEPLSLVIPATAEPAQIVVPTATAAPIVCNPDMPSRLLVGQLAQVTPGLPNNVRANPGTSSAYVGEIPPESPFRVLAGPECASGMAWWQVDYQGMVGWTPEGETIDDYWLEPLVVPITASNASQLEAAAQLPITEYQNILLIPVSSEEFIAVQLDGVSTYRRDDRGYWSSEGKIPLPENTYAAHVQPAVTTNQVLVPLRKADETGGIQVFDVLSGQVVFTTPDYDVVTAAISPDGQTLVASVFEQVFVWHIEADVSGTEPGMALPVHHTQGIGHLVFSPDGTRLAAADTEVTVIYDTNTWEPLISIPDGAIMNDNDIAISPDNTLLAITGEKAISSDETDENFTRLWDIQTANLVRTLQEESRYAPRTLAFNHDGSILAVAGGVATGEWDTLVLWNPTTGEIINNSTKHSNIIMQVRFSPDGTTLATVDQNRNILLREVQR